MYLAVNVSKQYGQSKAVTC